MFLENKFDVLALHRLVHLLLLPSKCCAYVSTELCMRVSFEFRGLFLAKGRSNAGGEMR